MIINLKKSFKWLIILILIMVMFEINITKSFKEKNIDNKIGKLKIEVFGIKKSNIIIIRDKPYSIVIDEILNNKENRNIIIKRLEVIQSNKNKILEEKETEPREYWYDSEYIDLKHEDFILKLEYQIKTKDKIIDGKIETKMEYERKIYLTCPLWDAMMGI